MTKKILISCEAMTKVFEEAINQKTRYKCSCFTENWRALKAVDEGLGFDFAVLDYWPLRHNNELYQRIKEKYPSVPVIITHGDTDPLQDAESIFGSDLPRFFNAFQERPSELAKLIKGILEK